MIKIKSIRLIKLKNSKKIIVNIKVEGKIYTIFYKIIKWNLMYDCVKNADFLMPILFNIWYYLWRDVDLNWFSLSQSLLENLQKIEDLYNNRYWCNKKTNIKNYNLLKNDIHSAKHKRQSIFFSLWVDSFFTLYKTNINDLIFVNWFDIRQKDKVVFSMVKSKFKKFCKKNNLNWLIVETNLRDLTEEFCNRNQMFWSWLASIWLLLKEYNQYYISSWMDDEIWYPRWSHKDLDYLRWNWETEFVHFWYWIHRSDKIKFISNYDDIYDYLRVCRKNYSNKYNCGVCEKCIRTMLDFYNINKLNKFNILPKNLDISLVNNIEITDANFSYYNNLLNLWNLDSNCLSMISDKIKKYTPNKPWKKNKNIIFVDFNGVISYKNFWFSLEKDNSVVYEKINEFLFRENIQMVKDWMLWKYQSEEICKFLSDSLNVDYDYIYDTFVEDCKNIDLSWRIRELLNELKKYYYIVLVTDNMDSFTKITVKNNLDYFNVFDSIFNSADEWYFKVDVYSKYVNHYDSKIELSYLIDDSAWNCKKFSELWWKVMNVKWEEQVSQNLGIVLKEVKRKRERQI